MAPESEAERKQREEQEDARYKAIRDEKASRMVKDESVPRCERCVRLHRCCPGPELKQNGEWDYNSDCLRCSERKRLRLCDFLDARTHV
jgi:hypothetical protein